MNRQEKISYSFLESDRIWPPVLALKFSGPFIEALIEVLKRLPDDAYDVVEDYVCFVVEDPQCLAINVPFRRDFSSSKNQKIKCRLDTIVLFERAFQYSHNALVGLIAHELAHSLQSQQEEYVADELATDELAIRWGFDKELQLLRSEMENFKR